MQTEERYAGFWLRVLASLIDSILFAFILLLIHALFFGDSAMQFTLQDGVLNVQSNNGMSEQLVMIVVTLIMWVKFLGTPGKLVLGCHVIDAKTKQNIKPLQALIRYLSYFVSVIPLGLGFLWIAWDKKKQGFHDKIAGTIVVVETTHLNQDESQKTVEELMAELR